MLVGALAACGTTNPPGTTASSSTNSSSSPSSTSEPLPCETVPSEAATPETPSPTETTPDVIENRFGDTDYFTQNGSQEFEVTVAQPTNAACQYSSMSCQEPQVGDRVVNVRVVIKNDSTSPVSVEPSMFALDFPDGTRTEPFDGASIDYMPGTGTMDYNHKVRAHGTYTSTLTFEAPKESFDIVMLDSTYGGSDLAIWH